VKNPRFKSEKQHLIGTEPPLGYPRGAE
jgi:hypothetical protein